MLQSWAQVSVLSRWLFVTAYLSNRPWRRHSQVRGTPAAASLEIRVLLETRPAPCLPTLHAPGEPLCWHPGMGHPSAAALPCSSQPAHWEEGCQGNMKPSSLATLFPRALPVEESPPCSLYHSWRPPTALGQPASPPSPKVLLPSAENSEVLGFRFGLERHQNDQTQNAPQKRIEFLCPVQDQQLGVSRGCRCRLLVDLPGPVALPGAISEEQPEGRRADQEEKHARKGGAGRRRFFCLFFLKKKKLLFPIRKRH